jgi:integrase
MAIEININYLTLEQIRNIIYSKEPLKTMPYNIGYIAGDGQKIILTIMYKNVKVQANPYKLLSLQESPYIEENRKHIQLIILQKIYIIANENNKIISSLTNSMKDYRAFFRWLDENNLNYQHNFNSCREHYALYTTTLIDCLKTAKKEQYSINQKQARAAEILNKSFPNVSQDIVRIPQSKDMHFGTEPYSKKELEKILSLYYPMFDTFSNVVLTNQKFPFKFNFNNKSQWIFTNLTEASISDNHEKGIIYTPQELHKITGDPINLCSRRIATRKFNLKRINENAKDKTRIYVAKKALKAYIVVFLFDTGMNLSVALNLTINDFEINHLKKEIFIIGTKYRGGKQDNIYTLVSEQYDRFIKFLKLREYLLDGHTSFENLFFHNHGDKASTNTSMINGTYLNVINCEISDLYNIPRLDAKKIRMFKSNELALYHSTKDIALALQHSEEIHHTHYSNSTFEQMSTEITLFLNTFYQCNVPLENNYFNTINVKTEKVPMLDCINCKNYSFHNTSEDINKFKSYKFILNQIQLKNNGEPIKTLIKNMNEFKIYSEIAELDKTFLPQEIDDYHQKKYIVYKSLGII